MNAKHSQKLKIDHWWQPFTPARQFQKNPRIFTRAEGCFLYTDDGRDVLDITACLWCMNLGHGRREIAEAISRQVMELDFAPGFAFGNPLAYQLAERLAAYTPEGLDKVFFTNSGSESVDTAVKIAMAYQHARGHTGKKGFVSREKAYHGINLGGTALSGIANNRRGYANLLQVDFLPDILDISANAFSRGLPLQGAEKADQLEQIIRFRGADSIAAVIVEPIIGAGGMVLPPQGYLQRLRELCDRHDILLILDEVITGYGRTGSAFAATEFDVVPDLITSAKGITGGTVPLGAVFVSNKIYQTIINAASGDGVEFFHGYTYSGHPVAMAASMAALDLYEKEQLFTRASGEIGRYWQDALHSLQDLPGIIDIRNYGLLGGISFSPDTERYPQGVGMAVHQQCFKNGLLCRGIGDAMVMSPPLTITKQEIDLFVERFRASLLSLF